MWLSVESHFRQAARQTAEGIKNYKTHKAECVVGMSTTQILRVCALPAAYPCRACQPTKAQLRQCSGVLALPASQPLNNQSRHEHSNWWCSDALTKKCSLHGNACSKHVLLVQALAAVYAIQRCLLAHDPTQVVTEGGMRYD